jgi:hypothetical protein
VDAILPDLMVRVTGKSPVDGVQIIPVHKYVNCSRLCLTDPHTAPAELDKCASDSRHAEADTQTSSVMLREERVRKAAAALCK